MAAIDYETEYNVHARVPEHPQIAARREREAKAYRAQARSAEIGVAYGSSRRQIYDFFPAPGAAKAPLAMYIHGGGWRALSPSMFSHMAKGANANGVSVAVAGYDLCPEVSVATIIEEMRAAALFLWRRHRQRIFIYGHSAGAHLAACLVASDWKALASDVPADLIPGGYLISGVYDLSPLVETTQNETLRLDRKSAHACSPLFWRLPPGRKMEFVVGREESSEFIRQSRSIAETWRQAGAETRYGEIANANHFTVIDPLADPQSAMSKRVAEMARTVAQMPLSSTAGPGEIGTQDARVAKAGFPRPRE